MVITHQRLVLFGQRPVPDAGFEWQLPGGWMLPGEAPEYAARREVSEETGLQIDELYFIGITNNVFWDGGHSISLYFEAECTEVKSLQARESENCLAWEWRDWAKTTDKLYLPLQLLMDTDYRPFLRDKRKIHVSI